MQPQNTTRLYCSLISPRLQRHSALKPTLPQAQADRTNTRQGQAAYSPSAEQFFYPASRLALIL
jgi:hypothetical protein